MSEPVAVSKQGGPVFPLPADAFPEGTNAGETTCPICSRTWTVTPWDDYLIPACGCYGDDPRNAPCESCGLRHAWNCDKRAEARRG